MRIALAGRPGSGKTSLHTLLAAPSATGPGAPATGLRIAHADVPDPRLTELSQVFRPRKTTPARLQFEDLEQKAAPVYPALSAERREMLAHADLLLLVVALFHEHPDGWMEAAQAQWRELEDELLLLDLATVESRLERIVKNLRIGHKPAFPGEPELFGRLREALEAGRPLRSLALTQEELRELKGYSFLSLRPVLPAFNLGEDHLTGDPWIASGVRLEDRLEAIGLALGTPGVYFCSVVEGQIQELPPEDQQPFLDAYGLKEPAIAQIIRESYELAGLQCFFTVGEDEVRAWSIRRGSVASQAAGVIHSDLERGFVRAEVLSYADWAACRTLSGARDRGVFRLEGREYPVHDGDILNIRSGLAKSRA